MGKKRKHRHFCKATNQLMTPDYLAERIARTIKGGFDAPKWALFCQFFLAQDFVVELYEARQTFSKYVNLKLKGKAFKVRFSNHKPIKHRELAGDCDFFVGMTHTGVRTSRDAAKAALAFFGVTKLKAMPAPTVTGRKAEILFVDESAAYSEYCKKPEGMTDEEVRQLVPF